MRSIQLERTDKNSYQFNRISPSPTGRFGVEADGNSETNQSNLIDEASHLSLLKGLEHEAIELSFSSISDVSIECVKIYDDAARLMVKALLLSVSNVIGKRKFYLIGLKDLITGFSRTDEIELQESKDDFENLYHNLSLREQRVLHEVSKGNTSNEIASKLFISTNTVKNHRKNIKKKLDFKENQDYSRFLKWSLEYCDKAV
ncbi:helix-turn-helix transcriptional regulator [Cryomorpha ignava]|uniref:Helix-turn-helix transcriptional regulator n=1 Tax=Cryomorpha ignava TaxID=101383 RepID=A0A7K3WPJ6_9FLAO|nr:helix-turn-helix transcriptional regulator [Cryomorpha ignava]NEN23579.1 helix-turn-helix transcriptional regulator [Cryomorpha ignava]